MAIRNGDTVMWMVPLDDDCIRPDYYFSDGSIVIDADPAATMVSVHVGRREDQDGDSGEPFFRRIPAWMLQVVS